MELVIPLPFVGVLVNFPHENEAAPFMTYLFNSDLHTEHVRIGFDRGYGEDGEGYVDFDRIHRPAHRDGVSAVQFAIEDLFVDSRIIVVDGSSRGSRARPRSPARPPARFRSLDSARRRFLRTYGARH